MLSSIHPFGERAKNQRYWVTALFFYLGSLMGGLALGSLLSLLALSTRSLGVASRSAAVVVLLFAAVWDLTGSRTPSLARQVDERWLDRYRGWVYGIGFGVQLGFGFVTYVTSALTYGFAAAAVLYGEPLVGLIAGAVYGGVRGFSILLNSATNTPDRLRRVFTRLDAARRATRIGGGIVMIGVVVIGVGVGA